MEIFYRTSKLEKICQDHTILRRKYGAKQAKIIIMRLQQIEAAENLYDIKCLPQANLHSLEGKRKGQFAINLVNPYRLILLPINGNLSDLKTITSVRILEIVDYH